jgi:hypothetical protein
MRIKVLACKVFAREVSLIAAESAHTLDVTYLQQGLHDTPDLLRERLQAEIDAIDAAEDIHTQVVSEDDDYRAIVLAYGLCSNAIVGLRSKRFDLVVPRAHDCIAMIMGSRERYKEYFDRHPGTYWYTPGWIDQTVMPGKERVERARARYVDAYGEENADYLMEMEQEWLRKYNRCTYASWPSLDRPDYLDKTKAAAEYLGWEHDHVSADDGLMRRLLNGDWREDEVLIVPSGRTAEPSYDANIIISSE